LLLSVFPFAEEMWLIYLLAGSGATAEWKQIPVLVLQEY
jgi:hypothetical protein